MERLRKEMKSRPSRRQRNMALLAKMYSYAQLYPAQPDIQDYEIKKETVSSNRGGFGDCYKGTFLNSHPVAMKCLRAPAKIDTSKMIRIKMDKARVWAKLHHNHVLPLIGLYTLDSVTYMVSPWMDNGNAFDYVRTHDNVDRLSLLLQAAKGLKYLHEFEPKVIHGDIRGPNVLISAQGEACIADFGLSYTPEEAKVSYSSTWKTAGNPAWMAPELLRDNPSPRSASSDVFSYGRMILELTIGERPFHYLRHPGIYGPASKGEMPKRPEKSSSTKWLTDDVWALAENCCHPHRAHRPQMNIVVIRMRELWLINRNANRNARVTDADLFESPRSNALELEEV
ncbi:hypothetical protein BOTBODRAFT_149981 [Botryobasidium botryosum FD-172 SS1]|uniref:Protein kinase domain-containing protein n=1 Tax=Botryobasidium botryosum (strain FD-172 SS1) TaxID=930990 RepID=A0A067N018_BOTB1|nr:hypothetical protein BOTBODRAFT_149981 [Botryobasidium botryosum FD-172 SS1]